MTTSNGRTAEFPIDPVFLDRWSPRTFTGEPIDDTDLFTCFEAARWAPSSSNLQPWRFLYAKRGTPDWPSFFHPIKEGNKGWASNAAALLAVLSKRTAPIKGASGVRESWSHSFDAGAAWACFALQASKLGWVAHAIGGYDADVATQRLAVPDDYRLECMMAVGRYRAPSENAAMPSSRGPQSTFVRQGACVTSTEGSATIEVDGSSSECVVPRSTSSPRRST